MHFRPLSFLHKKIPFYGPVSTQINVWFLCRSCPVLSKFMEESIIDSHLAMLKYPLIQSSYDATGFMNIFKIYPWELYG